MRTFSNRPLLSTLDAPSASIIALVMVLTLAPFADASACQCTKAASPQVALETAEAVFKARAKQVSLETSWLPQARADADCRGTQIIFDGYTAVLCQEFRLQVVFDVLQSWKGVSTREVTIETEVFGTACGFSFDIGGIYLIYADRDEEGILSTSTCHRTVLLPAGKDELHALGKPNRDLLLEQSIEFERDRSTPPSH